MFRHCQDFFTVLLPSTHNRYEALEHENRGDVDNWERQVEALEKQIRSDKAFMEEQAQEREAEREEYEEKLEKLREELRSHAKDSPKVKKEEDFGG